MILLTPGINGLVYLQDESTLESSRFSAQKLPDWVQVTITSTSAYDDGFKYKEKWHKRASVLDLLECIVLLPFQTPLDGRSSSKCSFTNLFWRRVHASGLSC